MYLQQKGKNWYLFEEQKDKNGKWFQRTIVKFGRIKPEFKIPFIYRGMSDDLIKSIKDKSINLILTDPPYGLTQNQWDIKPDWNKIAKEYNRILTYNGQIAIFGTIPNIIDIYNGLKDFFDFRYDCVWKKHTTMWTTNYMPMRAHENIFVFKKKGTDTTKTTFNFKLIGKKDEPYTQKKGRITSTYGFNDKDKEIITVSDGIRYPLTVIEESNVTRTSKEYSGFPTQKPEKLMEFFIRGLSNVNDIIIDPYLGSGTTAKVSMENCRYCLGSEIDPSSYKIIEQRLKHVLSKYDVDWFFNNNVLKFPLKSMTEDW